MKKNRGISMIELVIVIIIMILIASFAFFAGNSSLDKAEATEIYTDMSNMVKAVSGVMLQRELGEEDDTWLQDYYDKDLGNGWYEIYGINDEGYATSTVKEKLELDTIKRNYMVNYETGEVMLSKPVDVLGRSVRTYESVRALMESDQI